MANDAVRVKKPSRVTMRKTNPTILPTYRSMMVSELAQEASIPADFYPSLCLRLGYGHQHLSMEDEVELKGIREGRTVYAKVETYYPGDDGNNCNSNSMMITTDLSGLDNMKNDLYTGSLNINISIE